MDIAVSVVSLADICIRQVWRLKGCHIRLASLSYLILSGCQADTDRYGTILIQTCKSYKHADREIRESILLIESRWLKIQRRLELLRDISSSLDEEYQIHQNSVLQVLQGKVQAAISLVDSVIGTADEELFMRKILSKKGETRRAKYAVRVKSSLKSIFSDLKEWSEVFDVSWYLIIRLASKDIDNALEPVTVTDGDPLSTIRDLRQVIKTSLEDKVGNETEKTTVFLQVDFFNEGHLVLPHSAAEIWLDTDRTSRYLVDEPTCTSSIADVCRLAKILRKIDPLSFGILRCRGVFKYAIERPGMQSPCRLVFDVLDHLVDPEYLRSSVQADRGSYTLDDRFALAKQLAKSVMFIHSSGFVHKNIRPETILIFRDHDTRELRAFLTGFQNFRLAEGKTIYQGDDNWRKNIYRHPTRQGVKPEADYVMQHDIYSLGVCLLEIGMGTSFVLQNAENNNPIPSRWISIAADASIKDNRKRAFECKRVLVKLAQDELPAKMGQRYTDAVVTCMTCLDKTDNNFGHENEFIDENGVLIGVRFIEKVLHPSKRRFPKANSNRF